jgi:hypothetical protein
VDEPGASALAPRGHNSDAFFSPKIEPLAFFFRQYPIDRLDGELFRIVFVTHPFEEFFVLRMTRIL